MNPLSHQTSPLRALQFASAAHEAEGQTWGEFPYSEHLIRVYETLRRVGVDNEFVLVAAILHDVLEDTLVSPAELKSEFGPLVYDLVESVTGRGANRRERNKDIADKCRGSWGRTAIKLADRVVNVELGGKLGMYADEHFEFIADLYEEEVFQDSVVVKLAGILDAALAKWVASK